MSKIDVLQKRLDRARFPFILIRAARLLSVTASITFKIVHIRKICSKAQFLKTPIKLTQDQGFIWVYQFSPGLLISVLRSVVEKHITAESS